MAAFARKISMLYKRPGYSWCLMGRYDKHDSSPARSYERHGYIVPLFLRKISRWWCFHTLPRKAKA